PGHSSPVLTRDRILVTAHEKDTLLVIALDRQTGKILWRKPVPRTIPGRLQNVNGPASPSPVTDGTNVYVFFQEYGLVSFDAAGKERWKLPLGPFNIFLRIRRVANSRRRQSNTSRRSRPSHVIHDRS
ncbi:MAG TPA: PQQ-binding-like beta-propeller repeat protein, partial [Pyrinomonadaceae bacterium]|nr:PQQ-binding-like beta-propeller repeat protein [Pyrinomonadaceae bacterium]